jgi:DNA modification methylase
MIWYHSDNRGMTPWVKGIMEPRRVYDMAFIASRGDRRLLKNEVANLYGAPLVSRPIHSTQEPDGMLDHFFSMLVDNTTTMLDPTCGSGSALGVAEARGAKSLLGIEYNPEYAKAANDRLNNQRTLRKLSKESKQ